METPRYRDPVECSDVDATRDRTESHPDIICSPGHNATGST